MTCVPVIDPHCNPVTDAVTQGAAAMIDEISKQASDAAIAAAKGLLAGWLVLDSPDVSQNGAVYELRNYTGWATAAIAVGAVLVAAIRLALRRNAETAGHLGRGLAWLVILTGAGIPAVELLLQIGDSYSVWIVNTAADNDAAARIALFATGLTAAFSSLATIGVALLMWLACLIQIIMMLGRSVGLILLVGLLPIAGAIGVSGSNQLRNRYLSWLLALVLYKPVAATIYAASFWMIGKGQDLTDLLTALAGFCIAIVALPALMRLVAPAVGVLTGGGGSGAATAGAVGAGGAQLASGAVRLAQARDSGGASGGVAPQGAASNPPPSPQPAPSGGSAVPAGAGGGGTPVPAGAGGGGGGATMAGGPVAAGAGAAVEGGRQLYESGRTATRIVGGTAATGAGGERQ